MTRVLVIGDPHCPAMHEGYPAFLTKISRKWDTQKTIIIGDLVDNAAISFHEKSPSLSSAQEEYARAKLQVAKLYQLFPEAEWLLGNHDTLTERQAQQAGILSEHLRSYDDIWNVPNWNVHPRWSRYILEGVVYAHGDIGKGGQFAAVKNARENFTSYVQGHHHSEAGVWYTTIENPEKPRIFGMNVGAGCNAHDLAFTYGRKFNRKPTLGCGVVINGTQAYFEPM